MGAVTPSRRDATLVPTVGSLVVPIYVSLLRGINVSGRNRIAMADLRALYEAQGHTNVTTYVQSGNVVSTSRSKSEAKVAGAIEQAVAHDLGWEVTVLVRTAAALGRVLAANPFASGPADRTKLHVTFLRDEPAGAAVSAVAAPAVAAKFAPDEFVIAAREVYLHCPNGYGNTKINNAFFEKKLGVAATTRNWKTVTQLAELAGA
jgi:uncharacterized protein (DUF1697 family)